MKKEDKNLLLKDLCARLPYGIYANLPNHLLVSHKYYIKEFNVKNEWTNGILYCAGREQIYGAKIEDIQLYLRPMSSMTEEEKDKLQLLHDIICDENYGDRYSPSAWSTINEWVDYCNSRHLDHYGLIEIGLALEAPEDMYSIESKE